MDPMTQSGAVRQYPARFTLEEWELIESGRKAGFRSCNEQIRMMVRNGHELEAVRERARRAIENCPDCPTTSVAVCPRCAALKEVLGDVGRA